MCLFWDLTFYTTVIIYSKKKKYREGDFFRSESSNLKHRVIYFIEHSIIFIPLILAALPQRHNPIHYYEANLY